MATQNKNTLKGYFNTGDRPTEMQFSDVVDSFVHQSEDKASTAEITAGTNNAKYVTPAGVKASVETFAPVKTVNGIAPASGNITLNTGSGSSVGGVELAVATFGTQTNSATNIFHIKLPYNTYTLNGMYHIKAEGYGYVGGEIIDIVWVGYCYVAGHNLINQRAHVNRSTEITAGQYVGSDNFIYLWFKVPNTYFCSFRIDSSRGTTGIRIKPGDLQIIVSPNAQL
ncbi:hypothetical protein FUA48_14045 [Flavobacterium alkalisoli]|uniref:Uncharacterized protein n=1 Tax=Flavobacterium alkalisoli TaxID=2602769 RepID=A0A5B9FY07_9FLAO|nr:hypothetical protein [Flavobacterium alkalisoli]QEE50658.1 hypothetical protein FUA48_14045 [Flavobacterium alkalisoli]